MSAIVNALKKFSGVASFIISFLLTPQIYERTIQWMSEYVYLHYGSLWLAYIDIGWFATIAFLVFFLVLLLLLTLISLLTMRLSG